MYAVKITAAPLGTALVSHCTASIAVCLVDLMQPPVDGAESQKLAIVGLGMPDTHSGTVYWVGDGGILAACLAHSCACGLPAMHHPP